MCLLSVSEADFLPNKVVSIYLEPLSSQRNWQKLKRNENWLQAFSWVGKLNIWEHDEREGACHLNCHSGLKKVKASSVVFLKVVPGVGFQEICMMMILSVYLPGRKYIGSRGHASKGQSYYCCHRRFCCCCWMDWGSQQVKGPRSQAGARRSSVRSSVFQL